MLLTYFPDQVARLTYVRAASKIIENPSYCTLRKSIQANLKYAKTFNKDCRECLYYNTPNSVKDLHTIMKVTGV